MSSDYDKAFQESLVQDLGFLQLGDSPSASSSPQTQKMRTEQGNAHGKSPMQIQEIPPFQAQAKGQQPMQGGLNPLPNPPSLPGQQPLPTIQQQALPPFTSNPTAQQQQHQQRQQQPLPPIQQQRLPPLQPHSTQPHDNKQHRPRKSTDSNAFSFPTAKPSAPGSSNDITALSGVILPALEAALQRRTYILNSLIRSSGSNNSNKANNANNPSSAAPSAAMGEQLQRQQYAHEKLRKLVVKAAGVFGEIERWDDEAPVGMGGDVSAFLEGFLEEVLVRVEPAEDESFISGAGASGDGNRGSKEG